MCIAHVMRSKIWYLYDMMFYANVFCTLSSEIHFKTCLPGLCLMFCTFCASVQVYLEGCLQSLWFIRFSFSNLFQFSNSLQDRQNIRNFSLPKLKRTLSHFFPFPLLKWSGVIQHDLWAMKGKVVITWKKELNNEPKVWSQTMLCVFPCPCPV